MRSRVPREAVQGRCLTGATHLQKHLWGLPGKSLGPGLLTSFSQRSCVLKKLCVPSTWNRRNYPHCPELDTGDILCPEGTCQKEWLRPRRKALSSKSVHHSLPIKVKCASWLRKNVRGRFYSQSTFGPKRQSIDNQLGNWFCKSPGQVNKTSSWK